MRNLNVQYTPGRPLMIFIVIIRHQILYSYSIFYIHIFDLYKYCDVVKRNLDPIYKKSMLFKFENGLRRNTPFVYLP